MIEAVGIAGPKLLDCQNVWGRCCRAQTNINGIETCASISP